MSQDNEDWIIEKQEWPELQQGRGSCIPAQLLGINHRLKLKQ